MNHPLTSDHLLMPLENHTIKRHTHIFILNKSVSMNNTMTLLRRIIGNSIKKSSSSHLSTLQRQILIMCIILLSACTSNKGIILYDQSALEVQSEVQSKVPSENTLNTPLNPEDIVTLTMPIEIDVVYIDGRRTTFTPGYQAFISYKLLPGKHIIGLKYQDMLTNDEGDNESIKSRTVLIEFNAKPGGIYKINFIRPKTAEEALALEKTLKLTMSDKKGIVASSYPVVEAPTSSWFSSKPFDANVAELFATNEQQNPVSIPPAENAPAKEHLQYWWKMSTQEEKKSFIQWSNSN